MKRLFANGITDELIVIALAAVAFLPWMLSFALTAVIGVCLLVAPRTRSLIFADKRTKFLIPFVPLSIIPPIFHGNIAGIASGFGILLVFLMFIYLSRVITTAFIDKVFNVICALSIFSAAWAVVEKILYINFPALATLDITTPSNDELRCAATFGNPNLYSSVICFATLIALHMLIEKRGDFKLYMITIAANLVGMLLCASIMGMIELAVGVILLLILKRCWRLLAVIGGVGVCAAFAVIAVPELLPHLSEAGRSFELRVLIWQLAFVMFRCAPLFGRGILSYMAFSPDYVGMETALGISEIRVTTNAHNLVIDSLLSFGIIGTLVMLFYFFMSIAPVVREYFKQRNRSLPSLALAAMVGIAVHCMFDVTLLWPQVAVLFLIIFASATAAPEKQ